MSLIRKSRFGGWDRVLIFKARWVAWFLGEVIGVRMDGFCFFNREVLDFSVFLGV